MEISRGSGLSRLPTERTTTSITRTHARVRSAGWPCFPGAFIWSAVASAARHRFSPRGQAKRGPAICNHYGVTRAAAASQRSLSSSKPSGVALRLPPPGHPTGSGHSRGRNLNRPASREQVRAGVQVSGLPSGPGLCSLASSAGKSSMHTARIAGSIGQECFPA